MDDMKMNDAAGMADFDFRAKQSIWNSEKARLNWDTFCKHAVAEWNVDIEGTMATVSKDQPFQIFYGTGYEVHGFDDVRAFYEERMRTFRGQGFYADDFLVNDDVMVARGWFKGSPKGFFFGAQASGKPMLFRLTLWVDFDDHGLVKGESAYFDGKEFARQAEHGYEPLANGDQKS
jgi:predicted ester cyclase